MKRRGAISLGLAQAGKHIRMASSESLWQQDANQDGRWTWPFVDYPLSLQCLGENRRAKSRQESRLIPSWSNFTGLWFKLFHIVGCETSSGMNLFCLESLVSIWKRPLWLAMSKPFCSSGSYTQTESVQLTFLKKHYLPFNWWLKHMILFLTFSE